MQAANNQHQGEFTNKRIISEEIACYGTRLLNPSNPEGRIEDSTSHNDLPSANIFRGVFSRSEYVFPPVRSTKQIRDLTSLGQCLTGHKTRETLRRHWVPFLDSRTSGLPKWKIFLCSRPSTKSTIMAPRTVNYCRNRQPRCNVLDWIQKQIRWHQLKRLFRYPDRKQGKPRII